MNKMYIMLSVFVLYADQSVTLNNGENVSQRETERVEKNLKEMCAEDTGMANNLYTIAQECKTGCQLTIAEIEKILAALQVNKLSEAKTELIQEFKDGKLIDTKISAQEKRAMLLPLEAARLYQRLYARGLIDFSGIMSESTGAIMHACLVRDVQRKTVYLMHPYASYWQRMTGSYRK